MTHDIAKLIPLTQGLYTIVDPEDYDALAARKWHAHISQRSNTRYALRWIRKEDESRELLLMHRVILNAPHDLTVDHVNLDGLDNRRSNIRIATRTQNAANRAPLKTNSSGFKGVVWLPRDQRWRAGIVDKKRFMWLGSYATPEEAALVYDTAAKNLWGEYAWLNFPEGALV